MATPSMASGAEPADIKKYSHSEETYVSFTFTGVAA
jgi:hypothetical protein